MARVYANENFPFPVVAELRRLGHDVLTIQEVGQAEKAVPDAEVLAFAVGKKRAILTLNRKHFIKLHGQRPGHAGIIVCTFDPDFPGQAGRIHAALESEPEIFGKLIRVNRPHPSES